MLGIYGKDNEELPMCEVDGCVAAACLCTNGYEICYLCDNHMECCEYMLVKKGDNNDTLLLHNTKTA